MVFILVGGAIAEKTFVKKMLSMSTKASKRLNFIILSIIRAHHIMSCRQVLYLLESTYLNFFLLPSDRTPMLLPP